MIIETIKSKNRVRLALVQSQYDPLDSQNIQKYITWAENADIICFPEAFSAGRSIEQTSSYIKKLIDEKENILRDIGRLTNTCVILPLVERADDGKLFNTSFVINNSEVVGAYRKIHVFPWGEFFFDCGDDHFVFEHEKCKVGLMICYDAAFPETSRILALRGAELIVVSASWPEKAAYLWDKRLIARALDNQVFVAGVNRCGYVEEEYFMGQSLVVDPRGEILGRCGNAEQILVVDIDLDQIKKEREREPVWYTFDKTLYQGNGDDKE